MKRRWIIANSLKASHRGGYAELMAATATITGSAGPLPLHRLDLDAYNRIVASGALEDRRVELLEGLIAEMSPQSTAHAEAIMLLTRHFANAKAWVRVQLPLEVAPDSEPEPDIALVAERPPRGEHPRTALLVIEVATSSQRVDREVKGRLYARAGVPTYWLIDVPARTVEVYDGPRQRGYARCERHTGAAILSCRAIGVADLSLAALFDGVGG